MGIISCNMCVSTMAGSIVIKQESLCQKIYFLDSKYPIMVTNSRENPSLGLNISVQGQSSADIRKLLSLHNQSVEFKNEHERRDPGHRA